MNERSDDTDQLEQLLRSLDGSSYGAYKRLGGSWQLDNCDLRIDRVQGDPFAAPSDVALRIDRLTAALPAWALETTARRVSAADFLLRGAVTVAERLQTDRGSGRSGLIWLMTPGQEVLPRTAVQIDERGELEVRLRVGLPANGRRIAGRQAAALLLDDLPDLVEQAFRADTLDQDALRAHIFAVLDQQALRKQLDERSLVAFVADGAILPRTSGIDPRPMPRGAVPFRTPDSLAVTLDTPHAGPLRGMGLPTGLTLIVGGGYHGKSTLLSALEVGVYDHVPGDGRERVVTRTDAAKVRAEDGRAVTGLDISLFIGELPGSIDTTRFSTPDASGSTSQAAAIVEARAAGSQLLLLDEDTSASNLLVRDMRMAQLVSRAHEPITPLVQRTAQLRSEGCSLVMVMGGSGDYFSSADTVVWMDGWQAHDATERAQALSGDEPTQAPPHPGTLPWRPEPRRLTVTDHRGRARVRPDGLWRLTVGADDVNLRGVSQLVCPGQSRAAGLALVLVRAALEAGALDLGAALKQVERQLADRGLDALSRAPRGDLARPRMLELAAVLARLRG